MKKKVVVIGSVLKPINDPRMYEKIGMALIERENCDVHIMGFCSHKHVCVPNMYFYPLLCANRLSWRRFTISIKFYKKLLKVKPDVVIVCAPDLLIVTAFYKILFRCKFLYDVQENYYSNLVHTRSFPLFIGNMFAWFVRGVEWVTRPAIDKYVLAEKCYAWELPFIKDRYVILENKYQPLTDVLVVPKRRQFFRLLYTGTIAESYGVFEAVSFAKALHQLDERFTLTIIGYAARVGEREQLRELVRDCDYITLVGVDFPVPHSQIIGAIQDADLALAPYRFNKSTKDRLPTKFYEYIYHRIPMIIPPNPLWESFCKPYAAALVLNFFSYEPSSVLTSLLSQSFYSISSSYDRLLFSNTNIVNIINILLILVIPNAKCYFN